MALPQFQSTLAEATGLVFRPPNSGGDTPQLRKGFVADVPVQCVTDVAVHSPLRKAWFPLRVR
jgi:hypothetical protein